MKTFFMMSLLVGAATFADGEKLAELETLVQRSFMAQREGALPVHATEVRKWNEELSYLAIGADERVAIKYMLSHWRWVTRNYLIEQAVHDPGEHLRDVILELMQVGYVLDYPSVQNLHSAVLNLPADLRNDPAFRADYRRLLNTHGDISRIRKLVPDFELEGPRAEPAIPPTAFSRRWRADRWLSLPGMDDYTLTEAGVLYRGLEWRNGDVFLVDVNQPNEGMLTSISEKRSEFSHVGTFVLLEHSGKKIPLIFEMHTSGLRVVPLNRYVSPEFLAYGELFRFQDENAPTPQFAELSPLVKRLLADQFGHDLNARPIPTGGYEVMLERGQRAVVCSSLVDVIFKTLGQDLDIPRSKIALGSLGLVTRLGLDDLARAGDYLTPGDLKEVKSFRRVGTIDNGFLSNVLRELVVGSPQTPGTVGHYFTNAIYLPSGIRKFNLRFINALVTTVATKFPERGFTGLAVRTLAERIAGYGRKTIPKAPPRALALVAVAGSAVGKTVNRLRSCRELTATLSSRNPFRLDQVEVSPATRTQVDQSLRRSGFPQMFDSNSRPID